MKAKYDSETDTLRILFRRRGIYQSEERRPGIIMDFDKEGNLVGFEILNASRRVENPRRLEPVEVVG